ncbi:MAG: IscA/HesB family protein [Desulfovibrio sp.]
MVIISPEAINSLREYFGDKEKETVRIYLANGGCAGPRLALALDKETDLDVVYDVQDLKFTVEKELLEATGKISVDASVHGFNIESENPVAPAGGGCGSCGCGGDTGGGCGGGC